MNIIGWIGTYRLNIMTVFVSMVILLFVIDVAILEMDEVEPIPIDKVVYTNELRNPKYGEVLWFLEEDQTDKKEAIEDIYVCRHFALDTVVAAEKYGIRCLFVIVFNQTASDKAHAIVGFNTTDFGWVYFEPQTDERVNPTRHDWWED